MTETEIEKTVRAFVRGEFDVLVSTTIVENGLDIARANTILIDQADHFGLAELHQLRGRVGRSSAKAYCYLLLDRDKPPGLEARARLKALEEFSHLGAGFAIAMKDLEIRGAGNLLGPQQSGHIAAVGYDMYCQLLRSAVESAKVQQPMRVQVVEVDVDLRVQAFLPMDFLTDPRQRLELLREMDEAIDDERLRPSRPNCATATASCRSRCAPAARVPPEARPDGPRVHGVQWVEDRIVVRHAPGVPLGGSWLDCFADVRPVEAGKTHLMLPPLRGKAWQADQVLEFLLAAITGKAPLRRQQAKVVPQASPPPSAGRARRPAQPERKRFPWE
jgi:hypothetical protein